MNTYRITEDVINAWNEIVFYKGTIVEPVVIDGMTYYRPVGSSDTPRTVYSGWLELARDEQPRPEQPAVKPAVAAPAYEPTNWNARPGLRKNQERRRPGGRAR